MFDMQKDNLLAIDLSPDAVRVLDVRCRKSKTRVNLLASEDIENGTPDSLPERQIRALATLIADRHLKAKRCVAAMPTTFVFTRSVTIDGTKNQTPEEQIRWTLRNCLPFDPRDLVFDFWPIAAPAAGSRTSEMLVVATQGSVVQRYLAGFESLGLSCEHLDVAPCAMASLMGRSANPDALVGAIALSTTSGYFAVIEKQQVLFWRPFDLPSAAQKAISAVQAGLDRVGDEISKCVSHMVGSMHLDNLSELLLFGHGAHEAPFSDYLTNRFHLPVRSPSPLDCFPDDAMPQQAREAVDATAATQFAAAIGLAVQTSGGAYHG